MNVRAAELRARVKQFAIRVVKFVRALPSSDATRVIGNQLLKSGTGEGVVVEEADETEHWLDLIKQAERGCGTSSDFQSVVSYGAGKLRARQKAGPALSAYESAVPQSLNPEIPKSRNP